MSAEVPGLADLVRAETWKLSRRVSVRLTLVLMVLIALAWPILLFAMKQMVTEAPPPAQVLGMQDAAAAAVTQHGPLSWSVADAMTSVLATRNFFLFRALLIAVVAVSVAGEFVGKTLREDLLRPVSRLSVLVAKIAALQVFVFVSLLLPLVVGGLLGVLLLGLPDAAVAGMSPTVDVLKGVGTWWGLTWLGDAGFATFVVALSVLIRSVAGTLGGVLLYWIFDKLLGVGLFILSLVREPLGEVLAKSNAAPFLGVIDAAIAARPWFPSAAFDIQSYYGTYDGPWQGFVALGLYTALSFVVAWRVLERIDID